MYRSEILVVIASHAEMMFEIPKGVDCSVSTGAKWLKFFVDTYAAEKIKFLRVLIFRPKIRTHIL